MPRGEAPEGTAMLAKEERAQVLRLAALYGRATEQRGAADERAARSIDRLTLDHPDIQAVQRANENAIAAYDKLASYLDSL